MKSFCSLCYKCCFTKVRLQVNRHRLELSGCKKLCPHMIHGHQLAVDGFTLSIEEFLFYNWTPYNRKEPPIMQFPLWVLFCLMLSNSIFCSQNRMSAQSNHPRADREADGKSRSRLYTGKGEENGRVSRPSINGLMYGHSLKSKDFGGQKFILCMYFQAMSIV
jgi:hypothetical protein